MLSHRREHDRDKELDPEGEGEHAEVLAERADHLVRHHVFEGARDHRHDHHHHAVCRRVVVTRAPLDEDTADAEQADEHEDDGVLALARKRHLQ